MRTLFAFVAALFSAVTVAYADPVDVSFGLTGSTERTFRGYAVTAGDPGVEAFVEASQNGFYARASTGNRSFFATLSDFEVLTSLGYRRELLGVSFDVGATYSYYGGTLGFGDNDNFEGYVLASTNILTANVNAGVRYASDFMFGFGDYWRYEGGVRHPIPVSIEEVGFVAFADFGYNDSSFGDWQDFRAGIQATRGDLFLRAYYTGTNDAPFWGFLNADDRAVLELGVLIR